jgi:hypothetical protein
MRRLSSVALARSPAPGASVSIAANLSRRRSASCALRRATRHCAFHDALTSERTAAHRIPDRNAIHCQSSKVKKIVNTSRAASDSVAKAGASTRAIRPTRKRLRGDSIGSAIVLFKCARNPVCRRVAAG